MRIFYKAIPVSNPKQRKLKHSESEFNCYKCFKNMIINLWFSHQEKTCMAVVRGSVLKIFVNIACI